MPLGKDMGADTFRRGESINNPQMEPVREYSLREISLKGLNFAPIAIAMPNPMPIQNASAPPDLPPPMFLHVNLPGSVVKYLCDEN